MIQANKVERAGLATLNEESKLYQQQPYDSTLKSLLEDQAREIIPYLVEGAELSRALDEMKEYYTGRERKLATQLLWFGTFLQRTDTVSLEDKRRIEEKMDQFDSLLEQNPYVQKKSAEAEEKGEVKALQRSVVNIVRRRFPALTDLAQLQVTQINKPDVLDYLIEQVSTAPDEAMVRQLLRPSAA
jgi:hypothetical protein